MKVIVHFKGGLGNQLIQYAFVQKFFSKEKAEVIFETSHYKFIGERQFFLNDFPSSKISRWKQLAILIRMYFRIIFKKMVDAGYLPYNKKILHNYIDDSFDFDTLHTLNGEYVFINGYFQHLMIFPLPDKNTFSNYLDKLTRNLSQNETYQLIGRSVNPVMLHLRRGDYVSNETVRKNMGTCGLDYFKRGIELATKNLSEFTLFVFSDDIDYAASLFRDFSSIHFVRGDSANPIEDFLLMRCFKYAVISNSTLSFMASILSVYDDDNITVVPTPWFESNEKFLIGTKKNWVYAAK